MKAESTQKPNSERTKSKTLAQAGEEYYRRKAFDKAFEYLYQAARRGNSRAQNKIAFMYQKGLGTDPDPEQATRWYKTVAPKIIRAAQLAAKDENFRSPPPEIAAARVVNFQETIRWYCRYAEAGDTVAQDNLGALYKSGYGLKQNLAQAVQWFRKAANKKYANAQFNLGLVYYHGQGVNQDHKNAFIWFLRASEQGHAAAQYEVARMCKEGIGTRQNLREAYKWSQRAARQNHPQAQHLLGTLHTGVGRIKKNLKQVQTWFLKAAKNGYAPAMHDLGLLYFNGEEGAPDYEQARKWFVDAAKKGYADSLDRLGTIYFDGLGVAPDPDEARKCWLQAARHGHSGSMVDLSWLYFTEADYPQATYWAREAAARNEPLGQANLAFILLVNGNLKAAFREYTLFWEQYAKDEKALNQARGDLLEYVEQNGKYAAEARKILKSLRGKS